MKQRVASFKKNERLCGVKAVSELFREGRTLNVRSLRVIYRIMPAGADIKPARVLVSVPKRHFRRAVDRNLVRRRIREAWRRNREPLLILLQEKGKQADIALIWTDTLIRPYDFTEKTVIEVITKLSGLKY
jgi:ribonuclease P protein component